MMKRARSLLSSRLAALLGATAALVAARPAAAGNIPCKMLSNPVYVTGSGKVTIALLARALAPSGVNLVYRTEGSCLAVDAIVNGDSIVTTPADVSASYWDMTGTELKCDLDATGTVPNIGISDVFPSTCPNTLPNGLPSNVRDFFGPVEAYVFVVPKKSTQLSISKAAAYFVYGLGAGSGVAPWTDEMAIVQRDPTSGSQQIMAIAAGVPADKFQGLASTSSADMVTKVSMAADPETGIGFVTGEVSSTSTAQINTLAYQDSDQTCGYWPDSTSTGNDKRNVRDGHYALWGPLHLLTIINAQGYPTDPHAKDVIAYLTGTLDPPGGFDLISLLAKAGIVPGCAMTVQRDTELGPLASFQPERSCGCYFDKVAGGSTTCKACTADAECPATAPRCNYQLCEAQ